LKLGLGQLDEKVWSAQTNTQDLMPIITPAYPAMNSTYNVNIHTKHVIMEEFRRGFDVMAELLKEKWQTPENWGKLFEPSDFFIKYSHYLACHIVGNDNSTQSRSWIGFVEAKLRHLTLYLEELPLLTPIHLHPVMSSTTKSAHSVCYFIGFHVDLKRLEDSGTKELYVDRVVAQFV
jgi:poly(A) polymerase